MDIPDSIVKAHTDWRMIDAFLKRHLMLSDQAHRTDAFRPCAQTSLRFWIRILMDSNQGGAIRRLLRNQQELLDPQVCRDLWLASFVPRLWKWRQEIKRKKRDYSGH